MAGPAASAPIARQGLYKIAGPGDSVKAPASAHQGLYNFAGPGDSVQAPAGAHQLQINDGARRLTSYMYISIYIYVQSHGG